MTAFRPSGRSIANLQTCHRDLRRVVEALWADGIAVQVICGHRDRVEQTKAYLAGKSKLQWPKSKHNQYPSRAMDLAPFPINWNDTEGFVGLGGFVMAKARHLGIVLRWGGDWDRDGKPREKGEWDLVHFELVATDAKAGDVTPAA